MSALTVAEILARALCSADDTMYHQDQTDDWPCSTCVSRADSGAAALAAAGLTAEAGETVTDWGVRWVDVEGRARTIGQVEYVGTLPGGAVGQFTEAIARYTAGAHQQVISRQRTRYPDTVTAWTEVES